MHTTFLYQMGRVGSNSINRALYNNGVKTLHAHWLVGDFPEAEFPTTKPKVAEWLLKGETPPLKVITPVREPMSRNLSAFVFSSIKYGVSGRQETPEELRELFIEKYNIHYPDLWFEKELLKYFNLDLYNKKFNHKRGYQVYKADKHKILILRLEDSDKILSRALNKLLGKRNIEMLHIRSLENAKYIGEKYKKLKQLKFPKEFIDEVYSLKYCNHLYTKEEINRFKEFWSN